MLWVLKRTVYMRRFFWALKTYVKIDGQEKIQLYADFFCLSKPVGYSDKKNGGCRVGKGPVYIMAGLCPNTSLVYGRSIDYPTHLFWSSLFFSARLLVVV